MRPVEVCNLKWHSIDLAKARIHVNRAKNGEPSTHPLSGVELRALRRLKRESIESPFVFVSERGSPFATAGYRKMTQRNGVLHQSTACGGLKQQGRGELSAPVPIVRRSSAMARRVRLLVDSRP
jgi:integrase